jgi:mRNA interferase MazF
VVNRGDVWWVEHSDAGRRPACVLTRQAAIPVLSSVLVAPATRTIRGIPTEVTLTRRDGMPDDCALSFDNLTTVPKALLTTRIASVPESKLAELCDALRVATGC